MATIYSYQVLLDIEKLLWAHSEFPGVGSNIGLLAFVIDWVWSLSVRRISVAEQYLQFRNVWNASKVTANVFVSDEKLEYECLFLHIKVGISSGTHHQMDNYLIFELFYLFFYEIEIDKK